MTVTFPRLTASEEAHIILQDIFEYDAEGMNQILGDLCEEHGIAYDWDTNGDEIDNLIIDHEDLIGYLYETAQTSLDPETDETEEVEQEEEIQF